MQTGRNNVKGNRLNGTDLDLYFAMTCKSIPSCFRFCVYVEAGDQPIKQPCPVCRCAGPHQTSMYLNTPSSRARMRANSPW